jgi:hypothetical protein
MAPRKGTRTKLGRRRRPRNRLEELTERARQEGRSLTRRERRERRRAMRAQTESVEELRVRLRGTALETRRRLRPVAAPVAGIFARVAPYITRSLLFVLQLIAALIALIMELGRVVISRFTAALGVVAVALADWLGRHVTPRSTVAFVGAAAAILLGIAQFTDYHGVAVDVPNYAGEVGRTAPAPMTGTETAGSAHLWILLPVAAVALISAVGAYLGNRRFAAGLVVCGVLGLAVAIAIDLPQGLDAGRNALAFYGAEAQLLGGFWVEVAASATLVFCGCLLPLYSRDVARPKGRRRVRHSRASHRDVGGMAPGLRAES